MSSISSSRATKRASKFQIVQTDSVEEEIQENSLENKIKILMINKCRCDCFIPNDKDICGCGRPLKLHYPATERKYRQNKSQPDYPKKWNPDEHTVALDLTDCFGDIKFRSKRVSSKFIRVDFRTPAEKVIEVMFDSWRMYRPNIVISVTGGAKNFTVKSNLRNALKKGIVKAALSTDGWLITGGTEEGIMKMLGEGVKEIASTLSPEQNIVLLGIANWSTIKNNHLLKKSLYENEPADYSVKTTVKNEEQEYITKDALIDPNHTHFIFVDNCRLNEFRGEIDFRAKLEEKLLSYSPNGKDRVPMVSIVVGGGPGTYATCLQTVMAGSPCVFIDGTGGCSNVISYVYRKIEEKQYEENEEPKFDVALENEVLKKIELNLPDKSKEFHAEVLKTIKKMFEYQDYLNIFSVESADEINELDEAILKGILKAQRKQSGAARDEKRAFNSQVKLALTWNRIDVADKYIFNEDKLRSTELLKEVTFTAITQDKPDFVELFLDNGLVFSKFLTYRCLLKLYNEVPRNTDSIFFANFLRLQKKNVRRKDPSEILIKFEEIGAVVQNLLNNFYKHDYLKYPFNKIRTKHTRKILEQTGEYGDPMCDENGISIMTSSMFFSPKHLDIDQFTKNPEHDLFIYALMTNKPRLAKLFLKEGKNELCSALIASKIYKSFADNVEEGKDEFIQIADEFEQIAVDIIQMCYQTNKKDARLLLMREIPEFGNATCLEIAKLAGDRNFMSHPCVQDTLVGIWYDKIQPDSGYARMFGSLLCPPLAPLLCSFKEKSIEDTSKRAKEADEEDPEEIKTESLVKENSLLRNRITYEDNVKKLNYFKKIYYFLNAPIVKFLYDKCLYMIFLLLLSYMLLCDFFPLRTNLDVDNGSRTSDNIAISSIEVIVIIWVGSFFVKEMYLLYFQDSKIIWTKLICFFTEYWNMFEFMAIVVYTVGLVLRFIPDCEGCYQAARITLSLDLILWFFKALQVYTTVRVMGPKLIMIRNMFYQLCLFMLIILLFIFAFGIVMQALTYHNVPLNWQLMVNVFLPSFFILGGQYDNYAGFLSAETCEIKDPGRNVTDIYTQSDCPDFVGSQFALAIYVVYLLFLDILLINLLIAIMGNTYEEINAESDKVWKYQRYSTIYEYFHIPSFLPPFILLYSTVYVFKWMLRAIKLTVFRSRKPPKWFKQIFNLFGYRYTNGFKIQFEHHEQIKSLEMWENNILEQCFIDQKELETNNVDVRLKESLERYEELVKKSNSVIVNREGILKKVENISDNVQRICQLMQSKGAKLKAKDLNESMLRTLGLQ